MRVWMICGLAFCASSLSFASGSDVAVVSRWILSEMLSTHYTHHIAIDERNRVYDADCSGFAKHVIDKVSRPAAEELEALVEEDERPLARDFVHLFEKHGPAWQTIHRVGDLKPGDVIGWLIPKGSSSSDTGHVMFVNGRPRPSTRFPDERLIPVIDSTTYGHGEADPREEDGPTGVGAGVIGLVVDDKDRPEAFYWSGGESSQANWTKIRMGRPR